MIQRFNPTATAVQYDGGNEEEVKSVLQTLGVSSMPKLERGKWYVYFLGDLKVMDDMQFRAAQGLV